MARDGIRIDDQATPRLRELLRSLEDTGPVMAAISSLMLSRTQLGFRSQTDPYGRPWAPLKHRQGQILRDTSRLRNSIVARSTKRVAEVGTNVLYAATHQFGREGPEPVRAHDRTVGGVVRSIAAHVRRQSIPARKIFPDEGIPDDVAVDVIALLNDFLEGAGRG